MIKIAVLLCLMAVAGACNKPNELPPTSNSMNVGAKYKMPESTALTDAERAVINAIRNEHDSSKP